ncbi:MAG: hypothetical protein HRT44_01215 [Bdellovibrionales bacterium]|nr:hypothetical protein [Bdellovibrionales bacterium]NQZ17868.1 hypothetical protein [Bdellovibrionales bacterium]
MAVFRFSFVALMSSLAFLASCSSLYKNSKDSEFYGRYMTHQGPPHKLIELVLEKEGRGYFLIGEKQIPVYWHESRNHLTLTYLSSVDRYEVSWLVNTRTGEKKFSIRYLNRPQFPRGPYSPMMMIKTSEKIY